jgi:uncharacterized membrane protein
MQSVQGVSLIAFAVSTLLLQSPVSAQSCGYDSIYDNDEDGVMDIIPPGCGTSPNFPTYPTYPNNANGFVVCNKSNQVAVVAYSAYDGQSWIRTGWIGVGIGQCSQLTSDIFTRYVYLYAEGTGGTRWIGNQPICIHPTDAFTLPPMRDCSPPYKSYPFIAVDTGDSRSYRLDLLNP